MKINLSNRSDEQRSLLIEGLREFTIVKAIEKVSKQGNEMIQLFLKINEPNTGLVIDYLLANNISKLKQFIQAIKIDHVLEKKEINVDDVLNQRGKAQFVIEESKFGKQIVVAKYLK